MILNDICMIFKHPEQNLAVQLAPEAGFQLSLQEEQNPGTPPDDNSACGWQGMGVPWILLYLEAELAEHWLLKPLGLLSFTRDA